MTSYLERSNTMSNEEKQALIEEKQAEINGLQDLLKQGDYKARKEISEIYSIIKAQFPSVATPVYDKYAQVEAQAQQFRNRINELEEEIKELED